jgi:hypothetical protein
MRHGELICDQFLLMGGTKGDGIKLQGSQIFVCDQFELMGYTKKGRTKLQNLQGHVGRGELDKFGLRIY